MSTARRDPTRRFSSRVAHYARARPGYPSGVIDTLADVTGLRPGAVIADVGSGTGLSSEPFLRFGAVVYGIEPNPEMRHAAESLLGDQRGFHSVDGSAEDTTLDAESVDYVVAGQSFHWFDRPRAQTEFSRILRPGGWCVLLWNTRRAATTPFQRDLDALIRQFAADYDAVRHDRLGAAVFETFYPFGYTRWVLDNAQTLDRVGLRDRILSTSYLPGPDEPRHAAMLEALDSVYELHHRDGLVTIEYDTEVYVGRLREPGSVTPDS